MYKYIEHLTEIFDYYLMVFVLIWPEELGIT